VSVSASSRERGRIFPEVAGDDSDNKGGGDDSDGKGDDSDGKGDDSDGKGDDSDGKGDDSDGKGDDSDGKGGDDGDKPSDHDISNVNFYFVDGDDLTVIKLDDYNDLKLTKDYDQPQILEDYLETYALENDWGDLVGYSVKAGGDYFHYVNGDEGWELVAYSEDVPKGQDLCCRAGGVLPRRSDSRNAFHERRL
jgi:hypothetical protein